MSEPACHQCGHRRGEHRLLLGRPASHGLCLASQCPCKDYAPDATTTEDAREVIAKYVDETLAAVGVPEYARPNVAPRYCQCGHSTGVHHELRDSRKGRCQMEDCPCPEFASQYTPPSPNPSPEDQTETEYAAALDLALDLDPKAPPPSNAWNVEMAYTSQPGPVVRFDAYEDGDHPLQMPRATWEAIGEPLRILVTIDILPDQLELEPEPEYAYLRVRTDAGRYYRDPEGWSANLQALLASSEWIEQIEDPNTERTEDDPPLVAIMQTITLEDIAAEQEKDQR